MPLHGFTVLFLMYTFSFALKMNFKTKCLKYMSLNDVTAGPSILEKWVRPKPVGVPRKRMELPFAVLMMRSSYTISDELDFIAMDEFQRNFFLFRQSEWETYRNDHPNSLQGDLADPVYFDFISFAQYAVISEAIKNGKYEFVEKVGADGNTTIVHRDPALSSNIGLPFVHSQRVGDAMLNFIYEKYPASILPKMSVSIDKGANTSELLSLFLSDVQLLLDVLIFNSFALNMKINLMKPTSVSTSAQDSKSRLAEVTMQAPVNLWSLQVLSQRRDEPTNNFDIKLIEAFSRSNKYMNKIKFELIGTKVTKDIDVTHLIRLTDIT